MNMDSYECCKPNTLEVGKISSLHSLLKIIDVESRLKILCILRQGQHCVCEMIEHTGLSQSLVSHHLKDLKNAGLIDGEKRGKWVYYTLTNKGHTISDLLFNLE
jgi:DNA-binding transcriptional ArsR family regulator